MLSDGWHAFADILSPFGGSKPLLAKPNLGMNPGCGFISNKGLAFVDILSPFGGSKPLPAAPKSTPLLGTFTPLCAAHALTPTFPTMFSPLLALHTCSKRSAKRMKSFEKGFGSRSPTPGLKAASLGEFTSEARERGG